MNDLQGCEVTFYFFFIPLPITAAKVNTEAPLALRSGGNMAVAGTALQNHGDAQEKEEKGEKRQCEQISQTPRVSTQTPRAFQHQMKKKKEEKKWTFLPSQLPPPFFSPFWLRNSF